MSKKRKDRDKGIEGMTFDEPLARLIQAERQELLDELERVRREQGEVERYVEERRESIRRGARRSKGRFRL